MPVTELTDREVAVTIDSLSEMRHSLNADGIASPNVDRALDKIGGLLTPSTDGLIVATDRWATFNDKELICLSCALSEERSIPQSADLQVVADDLFEQVEAAVMARPDLVAYLEGNE